jgi:hypothetical protein
MLLLERATPPSVQAFFNVGILSLSVYLYGKYLRFIEWYTIAVETVGLDPNAA